MPTDTTTLRRPATGVAGAGGSLRARRPHQDSPQTSTLFARFVELRDGPERDAVREELVAAWLPMAHRIAGRFRDRGEAMEDLRQVAALGLLKAIDRFDPTQGAFESYAVPTVTGELKRHFRDRMWAVRVPRRVQELRNQVRLARRELTEVPGGEHRRSPSAKRHPDRHAQERTAGTTPDPQIHQAQGAAPC